MRKISANNIKRMTDLEKEFGITDLSIYAYVTEDQFNLFGEIISEKINKNFYLSLVAYDRDNSILFTCKNDSYGSGIVTSEISKKVFFNGYPFAFSYYDDLVSDISKIKIFPVEG